MYLLYLDGSGSVKNPNERYFDQVVRRFDTEGGVMHGLVHRKLLTDDCHCPACLSRSLRGTNIGQ